MRTLRRHYEDTTRTLRVHYEYTTNTLRVHYDDTTTRRRRDEGNDEDTTRALLSSSCRRRVVFSVVVLSHTSAWPFLSVATHGLQLRAKPNNLQPNGSSDPSACRSQTVGVTKIN